MKTLKHIIRSMVAFLCLSSILFSCLQSADNESEKGQAAIGAENGNNDTGNLVTLTAVQFQHANIQLGMLESQVLSGQIAATGKIDVPPENLISITPLLGGVLQSTPLQEGSSVKKGQVVAVLQNPEFIALQQEYLEAQSQLTLATTEYERQQKLAEQEINSKKVLQKARSIFESARITSNSLKQRLQMINVDPEQITADRIQQQLNVYAPATGFITKVNINKGKYIGPQETMFEMVTNAPLHIDLKVFERDIPALKEGQRVLFKAAGDTTTRLATIELMEKTIAKDNTLTVHCVAEEEGLHFMPGAYVEAKIETSPKPVPALPTKAVVTFEGKSYIFIEVTEPSHPDTLPGNYAFRMIPVHTGGAANDYFEIKPPYDDAIGSQRIVLQGAYDLLSQLKNEAE